MRCAVDSNGGTRQEGIDTGRGRRRAIVAIALATMLGIGGLALIGSLAQTDRYGTPAGTNPPAGGITSERAIEIASGTKSSQAPSDFRASAQAQFDWGYARWTRGFARWTWHVSWGVYAGPTGSTGCDMVLDFFTGEILDRQCWIS